MSVSIRVIPCLDVADGRVVKGVNFQNLKDAGDPVELARLYYQDGADELTFLDVNATNENRATMYDLVSATAEQVFIPLTVGGGVRTVDDVARLLGAGADKVSVSSAAIARPRLISEISQRYGSQVLVLSLDAKRGQSPSGFVVTTNGGRQTTDNDALEWLQQCIELGVGEVLINSIDADGMQSGFDEEMIAAARSVCSVPLVASGGAGKSSDFVDAALSGADAVLAASIFHNRSVTIRDVKATLASAGFETR